MPTCIQLKPTIPGSPCSQNTRWSFTSASLGLECPPCPHWLLFTHQAKLKAPLWAASDEVLQWGLSTSLCGSYLSTCPQTVTYHGKTHFLPNHTPSTAVIHLFMIFSFFLLYIAYKSKKHHFEIIIIKTIINKYKVHNHYYRQDKDNTILNPNTVPCSSQSSISLIRVLETSKVLLLV